MAKYLLKIICSCLESCFFMSSKLYDSVLKTNRVFSCMKASTLEVLRRHFSNFFGKNCLLKYVGIDISVLFRPDIIYFRNFFFLDLSWNFSGILPFKKIHINTKSFVITCFAENLNVLIKKNA